MVRRVRDPVAVLGWSFTPRDRRLTLRTSCPHKERMWRSACPVCGVPTEDRVVLVVADGDVAAALDVVRSRLPEGYALVASGPDHVVGRAVPPGAEADAVDALMASADEVGAVLDGALAGTGLLERATFGLHVVPPMIRNGG